MDLKIYGISVTYSLVSKKVAYLRLKTNFNYENRMWSPHHRLFFKDLEVRKENCCQQSDYLVSNSYGTYTYTVYVVTRSLKISVSTVLN
jgi:hypothetical protein